MGGTSWVTRTLDTEDTSVPERPFTAVFAPRGQLFTQFLSPAEGRCFLTKPAVRGGHGRSSRNVSSFLPPDTVCRAGSLCGCGCRLSLLLFLAFWKEVPLSWGFSTVT